ncbi:hypothetical protein H9P43_008880 [Blastocladiella emersonii ATCC 22665]|nr:hypothetical protein H9P43_008880 [Blastocladiella emersonii ATCC 22665]
MRARARTDAPRAAVAAVPVPAPAPVAVPAPRQLLPVEAVLDLVASRRRTAPVDTLNVHAVGVVAARSVSPASTRAKPLLLVRLTSASREHADAADPPALLACLKWTHLERLAGAEPVDAYVARVLAINAVVALTHLYYRATPPEGPGGFDRWGSTGKTAVVPEEIVRAHYLVQGDRGRPLEATARRDHVMSSQALVRSAMWGTSSQHSNPPSQAPPVPELRRAYGPGAVPPPPDLEFEMTQAAAVDDPSLLAGIDPAVNPHTLSFQGTITRCLSYALGLYEADRQIVVLLFHHHAASLAPRHARYPVPIRLDNVHLWTLDPATLAPPLAAVLGVTPHNTPFPICVACAYSTVTWGTASSPDPAIPDLSANDQFWLRAVHPLRGMLVPVATLLHWAGAAMELVAQIDALTPPPNAPEPPAVPPDCPLPPPPPAHSRPHALGFTVLHTAYLARFNARAPVFARRVWSAEFVEHPGHCSVLGYPPPAAGAGAGRVGLVTARGPDQLTSRGADGKSLPLALRDTCPSLLGHVVWIADPRFVRDEATGEEWVVADAPPLIVRRIDHGGGGEGGEWFAISLRSVTRNSADGVALHGVGGRYAGEKDRRIVVRGVAASGPRTWAAAVRLHEVYAVRARVEAEGADEIVLAAPSCVLPLDAARMQRFWPRRPAPAPAPTPATLPAQWSHLAAAPFDVTPVARVLDDDHDLPAGGTVHLAGTIAAYQVAPVRPGPARPRRVKLTLVDARDRINRIVVYLPDPSYLPFPCFRVSDAVVLVSHLTPTAGGPGGRTAVATHATRVQVFAGRELDPPPPAQEGDAGWWTPPRIRSHAHRLTPSGFALPLRPLTSLPPRSLAASIVRVVRAPSLSVYLSCTSCGGTVTSSRCTAGCASPNWQIECRGTVTLADAGGSGTADTVCDAWAAWREWTRGTEGVEAAAAERGMRRIVVREAGDRAPADLVLDPRARFEVAVARAGMGEPVVVPLRVVASRRVADARAAAWRMLASG